MELYHYLPSYPDFYNNLSEVIGSDDDEYDLPYTSLLKKKEFFENKLARTEDKPKKAGDLMKHQTFIARFMSSHTPYNGILLMHQPGTGKTCASVAAIEKIRNENSDFKRALVIMKGQGLIDNYRNELVYNCTDGIYVPENESYDDTDLSVSQIKNRKRRKLRKRLSSFYTFKTFETFSKEIADMFKNMTIETIKNLYKNMIVVIDEVHNLRQNKSSKQYNNIYRFLHTISNSKIILMTGTPMRDEPSEIADIMNLILPRDKQIETKDDFNHEYLDSDNVLSSLPKQIELKKLLRGRVSYLRGMKSDVTKEFIGDLLKTKHVLLYPVEMESVQAEIYNETYTLEEKVKGSSEEDNEDGSDDDVGGDAKAKSDPKKKKGAFYLRSRMASLFVYPDKRTGKDGFEKNIKKMPPSRFNPSGGYSMTESLRTAIMDGVAVIDGIKEKKEKMLSNIRKYGCKYAECIEKILASPDESHFVYMEFVQNSGAILFTKLLELFKFTDSSIGRIDEPRLRYALLTGEKSSEITSLIETFNGANNATGEYINVIIGSSVLAEGFTLKNVQNVHILTPSWNFSETDQVIARAFRLFSHESLKEQSEKSIIVKIYLYCAIFNHDLERSIDWRMFKTSEDKDIAIKSIERVLKEISVDCALNKERNIEMVDNTRECEYMDCAYICEEEPYEFNAETDLDTSTYNLYYDSDAINHYISIISTIFQSRYKITFSELLRNHNNDRQTLMKAIHHMISNNYVIKDKLGFHCFLRQEHDYLYLTHTLKANHTFLDVYYVEHFPLQQNLYNEHFNVLENTRIAELCRTVTSDELKSDHITKFPIDVQEMMLKLAIQHESVELNEKSIKNRDAILSHFKNKRFAGNTDDTIIITVKKPYQCFSIASQTWSECTQEQEKFVTNLIDTQRIIPFEQDYVGQFVVDRKGNGKFKIINLRATHEAGKDNKRQQSTGRVCKTIPKDEILAIIDTLKVEMDDITPDQFKTQFGLSFSERLSTLVEHIYLIDKDGDLNAKFNAIRDLYTKEELQAKDRGDLIRILFWGSSPVVSMCRRLNEWFTIHDLMYDIDNQKIIKK